VLQLWNNLFGVTLPTLGTFFTLQKKIVRNMAGAQPEVHAAVFFNRHSTYSMPIHTFINELQFQ
jgi:hypothetical protein